MKMLTKCLKLYKKKKEDVANEMVKDPPLATSAPTNFAHKYS
jgi:hypothetical protein